MVSRRFPISAGTTLSAALLSMSLLAYWSGVFEGGAGRALGQTIRVKARVVYEKKKNQRLLKIVLVNEGAECKCFRWKLPWSDLDSMTIVIARPDGRLLEKVEYPHHPVPGTVRIRRGEEMAGTVDLDARFERLGHALARDGVDVFWSYDLEDVDNNKSERVGGWLFVPKEGG